jgi:hypothetical protein
MYEWLATTHYFYIIHVYTYSNALNLVNYSIENKYFNKLHNQRIRHFITKTCIAIAEMVKTEGIGSMKTVTTFKNSIHVKGFQPGLPDGFFAIQKSQFV